MGITLPSVKQWIQGLSARGEFALVTAICFGHVVASSAAVLLLHVQRMEISTSRALRGTAIEIAVLLIAGWILHLRGWRFRELAGRFSWMSVLSGLPLFLAYMILYWFTALALLSFYPAAAKIVPFRFVHTASPLVVVLFFVVNSIFEEFAVTGYVIKALERNGLAFSVTASTLIRFLYHLYQGPLASVSILPLGILFGIVYWRTRNLWPLVTAHTIANLVAYAVAVRA